MKKLATVRTVREKKIKDINQADYDEGHEKYSDTEALVEASQPLAEVSVADYG